MHATMLCLCDMMLWRDVFTPSTVVEMLLCLFTVLHDVVLCSVCCAVLLCCVLYNCCAV